MEMMNEANAHHQNSERVALPLKSPDLFIKTFLTASGKLMIAVGRGTYSGTLNGGLSLDCILLRLLCLT
jgi:hypothetical protein